MSLLWRELRFRGEAGGPERPTTVNRGCQRPAVYMSATRPLAPRSRGNPVTFVSLMLRPRRATTMVVGPLSCGP